MKKAGVALAVAAAFVAGALYGAFRSGGRPVPAPPVVELRDASANATVPPEITAAPPPTPPAAAPASTPPRPPEPTVEHVRREVERDDIDDYERDDDGERERGDRRGKERSGDRE